MAEAGTAATNFKFQWVDERGNRKGLFSKRGAVDAGSIVLDGEAIPIDAVVHAVARFGTLVIVVVGPDGKASPIPIAVTSRNVDAVSSAVNRAASARHEARRRTDAAESAAAPEIRFETCPHCGSRVELTGMPASPQIWCVYCERIGAPSRPDDPDLARYGLCDGCRWYAAPVLFTSIFVWFAIIVYGWTWRRHWVCRVCMRREAWAMVGKNAIFLLGLPFALFQLVRAYASGRVVEGRLAGLDAANARARRGKLEDAVARYRDIELREGRPAGVIYCRGLAYRKEHDMARAATAFRECLVQCANYRPAYEHLAGALRLLKKADELEALRRQWGDEELLEQDRRALANPVVVRSESRFRRRSG